MAESDRDNQFQCSIIPTLGFGVAVAADFVEDHSAAVRSKAGGKKKSVGFPVLHWCTGALQKPLYHTCHVVQRGEKERRREGEKEREERADANPDADTDTDERATERRKVRAKILLGFLR